MSTLVINNVLMVINITFGMWFVVTAVAHILKLPQERDLRPMVLPIFVTLGYVILQLIVLVVYMKNPDEDNTSPIEIIWRLLEGGFIYSLNLVVVSHTKPRGCSSSQETHHDRLVAD